MKDRRHHGSGSSWCFFDVDSEKRLAGGSLTSCYGPSVTFLRNLELEETMLRHRIAMDWVYKVNQANIVVTMVLIVSPIMSVVLYQCFVRSICGVSPAHDYLAGRIHHGHHTLSILREVMICSSYGTRQ
jgi:hypothetical protein